jgi:hypothetical protein
MTKKIVITEICEKTGCFVAVEVQHKSFQMMNFTSIHIADLQTKSVNNWPEALFLSANPKKIYPC